MTGGRDLGSGPVERGAVYRRLGVEPIVNGRSTFTILGGSLMPPVVLDAMRSAAECFVDLVELQAAVGTRIAELTRNEAAFVSGGAAAGLFLSAAACMARDTDDGILRQADLASMSTEFAIHAAHRIPYDAAIELAGGHLVEFGTDEGTDESDLVGALGPKTVAVVYVPKAHLADAVLPLEVVVARAHEWGVPVIVDAAAQLPPRTNLWAFTDAGADLVLFSGGKALCGPASTGLILGRQRFVDLVARNAAPLHRPGRPMKAGKEDIVGLLAAVEWYLAQDEAGVLQRYEAMVEHFVAWGAARNDVSVTREPFGEAGQPTPRALICFNGRSGDERDDIQAALRAGSPRIDLLADDANGLYVAPETLVPGEEALITRRLEELLAG
jgi:L-seryl-tRNA(Ser) seleniumtransferase